MPAWAYNDGGAKLAGYRGHADDCVTRAIAIAEGISYRAVAALIHEEAKGERYRRGRLGFLAATGRGSTARSGVHKDTYRNVLMDLGYTFTPTMGIGTGCKVHLKAEELPSGVLIASCSRHLVAVIDGVIQDTYDPSRNGTRCVYGFWKKS